MTTKNELHARTLGAIAYAQGLPIAPALNPAMMNMIKGREVGDNRTIEEMEAYHAGWIQASIAAQLKTNGE